MSRILRRPMFRGGPVDSRGTGITSGLDKPKRGLVNEPGGYAGEKTGLDFLKQAFLGPRFLDSNFQSPMKFQSGTGFGFMTPERQAPGLIKIGESISARNPRMGPLGIDELAKPVTYGGSTLKDIAKSDLEMGEGDLDLSEKDKKELQDFYKSLDVKGDLDYKGGEPDKIVPTVGKGDGDTGTGDGDDGEKEEPVEYTIEDYIKMLGGDKARRRDLGDMFARASASFLGTGGVREGLAEFMKSEAAAGPSRREKIEQAAATLDIKDKIASKRAAENLKQTLAGIDYKIGATMAANKAASSLEGKSWIDSLRIVKESLFKGSDKGLDSASVIEETLRLKYQKPVRKYTVSSETEIPKLEVQEGFSIITLPDGSKKIFEVVEGQAKERTDLRV